MRGQAPRAFGAAPQGGASCCRSCRKREQAPRAFGAAPQNGGHPGEDLSVEVRVGCPREPHRRSRSSRVQNTNAQEATRTPPPGGSAEAQRGAGGVFTHSARPATRSPPLGGSAERSEARGACPRILHDRREVSCYPTGVSTRRITGDLGAPVIWRVHERAPAGQPDLVVVDGEAFDLVEVRRGREREGAFIRDTVKAQVELF